MRCSSCVPTATEPVKVMPGRRGMRRQGFADLAARAREVLKHAGWQARVADAVREQASRPGRIRRALDDDGVAGDERSGRRAAGERERKIEGCDHDPRAIRAHDAAVARDDVRQRVVRQLVLVAAVLLEVVGVVPEEVDRLLRLAERFHPVLADFEGECCCDFVDARFHDVRDTAQQAHSFAARCGAPRRERLVRGVHGGAASCSVAKANSPSWMSLSIGLLRET